MAELAEEDPRSRMRTLTLILSVLMLITACSTAPDDSHVLHLPGEDITEHDFTVRIRSRLVVSGGQAFCASLQGLSNKDALEMLDATQDGSIAADSDQNSRLRAMTLIEQECSRVIKGSNGA